MANIDLTIGTSEAVINNVLNQLFPAMSSLLKQSVSVHQANITFVDFEIRKPFQVDLTVRVIQRCSTPPSTDGLYQADTAAIILKQHEEERRPFMPPTDLSSTTLLSQAAFVIHVPAISLTVHFDMRGQPTIQTVHDVRLDMVANFGMKTGSVPAKIGVRGVSGIISTGHLTTDVGLQNVIVASVVDTLNRVRLLIAY